MSEAADWKAPFWILRLGELRETDVIFVHPVNDVDVIDICVPWIDTVESDANPWNAWSWMVTPPVDVITKEVASLWAETCAADMVASLVIVSVVPEYETSASARDIRYERTNIK